MYAKRSTVDPGGTALVPTRFPMSAVVVALGVAAAIILVFGVRTGTRRTEAARLPASGPIEAADPAPPHATPPAVVSASASEASDPSAQELAVAALDLEGTLRRQRLWGRVEITGPRIDVRSGSCGDPAMRPTIEGRKPLLRHAGLTKLRCLAQSGAVVFERDF
ncbi:MAG TPA: hypothetical protein VHN14_31825 [Kofleriaceae bacterium]|nr:hypothetical protein [Kofleriaceae bacterium]